MRIDVGVPPVEVFPAELREKVKPERAFFSPFYPSPPDRSSEGQRVPVAELEVGRWLTMVLSRWERGFGLNHVSATGSSGRHDGRNCDEHDGGGSSSKAASSPTSLEQIWWTLPFGSTISVDVRWGMGREEVTLVPDHTIEQTMLSVEALKRLWADEPRTLQALERVKVVDWDCLRFVRQLHETITLVTVAEHSNTNNQHQANMLVFKSAPHDLIHTYNELKLLLSLPPHPNLIPGPLALVTKQSRFGSRRGICGFLLPYYPLGSLRDYLLREDYHTTTPMAQKLRWARQIIQSLAHINTSLPNAGFYPDLKPDNILLKQLGDEDDQQLDAVLIDLEQRGGWFAWTPPEVVYLEYLELLTRNAPLLPNAAKHLTVQDETLRDLRAYYHNHNPAWSPPPPPPTPSRTRYRNAKGGFSAPWLSLLKTRLEGGEAKDQLERAQVFMLGKLLWCIFEGQPLVRCGIDHEVLRDPEPEDLGHGLGRSDRPRAFPEFVHTPQEVRRLIRACTAGAPEWEGGGRRVGVVLRGGKLYAASRGGDEEAGAKGALDAARRYWQREVRKARAFVRASVLRRSGTQGDSVLANAGLREAFELLEQIRTRPLFEEVLAEQEGLESRLTG
ncbi:hypothetical protein VTJ49DRAFT_5205 [Mycothermus thermophilus]|uniref:Protein kinase domain-containing protein n=1 Tax=Humicola insolens TaxID=85995 RepID=A0ABR3VKQ4_HUMIN